MLQSVKEEIRKMNESRIKWWPQYLAAITGNYKPLAKEEIKFSILTFI